VKKFNLNAKERISLLEMIETGRLSVGSKTDPEPKWCASLEKEMCDKFESKHAVLFNSGTSSIHAALSALGVNYCDEVISSPLTCYSAVLPIAMSGAVPIFADVSEDTLSIDPKSFRKNITDKTKAVLLPYIYGLPLPIKKFVSICRANEIALIEDCAHVPALKLGGKYAGTFGEISCFSFAQGKVLDCGEGGAALTNNPLLADEMRFFKDGGKRALRVYTPRGANNKMTNLEAFLAFKQVKNLEKNISARAKIAKLYFSACESTEGVSVNNKTTCLPSVALFKSLSPARDLILKLREKGVDAKSIYKPLNESNVFTENNLLEGFFNNDAKRAQIFRERNKPTPVANKASAHFFYIETDPMFSVSFHKQKAKEFRDSLR